MYIDGNACHVSVDKRQKGDDFITCVLHELVHVKQHLKKELKERMTTRNVEKQKIIQEYYNYYDLPWEKEIYELQEVLLNEYKKVWDKNPNMLVPYYLMFSYLYYKQNISLIDDAEYDTLCKTLLDKFDDIKHFHKHLINKDALTNLNWL